MRLWVGSCQNDTYVNSRPFSGTLNIQNEQWPKRSKAEREREEGRVEWREKR